MIYDSTRIKTAKCSRCGLLYQLEQGNCQHCRGKTTSDIIRDIHIPQSYQRQQRERWARIFFCLAIVLASFLLLLW